MYLWKILGFFGLTTQSYNIENTEGKEKMSI